MGLEQAKQAIRMQNEKGNTPFHLACVNGHLNVAEFLVKNKIVDMAVASTKNRDGNTGMYGKAEQSPLEMSVLIYVLSTTWP